MKKKMLSIFIIIVFVLSAVLPIQVNAQESNSNSEVLEVKWVMEPADLGWFTHRFSEGIGIFSNNGNGAIDSKGNIIIPYEYDYIYPFYNGLAIAQGFGEAELSDEPGGVAVASDGTVIRMQALKPKSDALIHKSGRVIIPASAGYSLSPLVDGFTPFRAASHGGLVKARKTGGDGKYGLLNINGAVVTPFIYDEIYLEHEGSNKVTRVLKNGKYGFIDNSGKEIIACKYLDAGDFREDLAAVKINNKWGFINQREEFVIPCIYDVAWDFSDGLAKVISSKKETQYIDEKGRIVLSNFYSGGPYKSLDFTGGMVRVIRPPNPTQDIDIPMPISFFDAAYMNKQGQISSFIYDADGGGVAIGEGYLVKKGEKMGLINYRFEEIVPFVYDQISVPLYEGLSLVKKNGKSGYMDETGELVIPCIYNYAANFSEGLALVKVSEKWGFINKTGKIVIPTIYDSASSFSKGVAWVGLNGRYGLIENPLKTTQDQYIYNETDSEN